MYLRIIIIIIITTSSELATHPEEVRRQTQGWLYCGQPTSWISLLLVNQRIRYIYSVQDERLAEESIIIIHSPPLYTQVTLTVGQLARLLTRIPSHLDTARRGRRALSVLMERKAGISAAPNQIAPKLIKDSCFGWRPVRLNRINRGKWISGVSRCTIYLQKDHRISHSLTGSLKQRNSNNNSNSSNYRNTLLQILKCCLVSPMRIYWGLELAQKHLQINLHACWY